MLSALSDARYALTSFLRTLCFEWMDVDTVSVGTVYEGTSRANCKSTDTPSYALYAPQIATSPDERIYYNFSNIRYAAPPVDSLRFQLPRDPVNNRSAGVQDGTYGKICPQSYTPWQNAKFVTAPPGELENEDCLFFDVVVPDQIWNQRCNSSRPVMVWIHGGGFQIGAKWGGPMTNPLGLQDRSFDKDGEGVIWVGLNYRVRPSLVSRMCSPSRLTTHM